MRKRAILLTSIFIGIIVLAVNLTTTLAKNQEMVATTFTVNNHTHWSDFDLTDGECDTSNGSGICTLTAAIQQANANGGHHNIHFNLPVGSETIYPFEIPIIEVPVTIDGTTQPGTSCSSEHKPGELKVVINGVFQALVSGPYRENIFVLGEGSSGSTIRGLVIGNNNQEGNGIAILSDKNWIACNHIGVEADGVTTFPNESGIFIVGNNNLIGGKLAEDRNVISGNVLDGIVVGETFSGDGYDNIIDGNYIGLDSWGRTAVANGRYGIHLTNDAWYTVIGSQGSLNPNVISGNGDDGIYIARGITSIYGNIIGLDKYGLTPVPNQGNGIYDDSITSVIGGRSAEERNIIGGNQENGIYVSDESSRLRIENNYIGLGLDGSTAAGNGAHGIDIGQATGTTIRGNVISANAAAGIYDQGWAGSFDGCEPIVPNTTVIDNHIGTNASGNSARGNGSYGIVHSDRGDFVALQITDKSAGQTADCSPYRGAAVYQENLISGNSAGGIYTDSQTRILSNTIGLNQSGSAVVSNGGDGIFAPCACSQISGNLISGNTNHGIHSDGSFMLVGDGNYFSITHNIIGPLASSLPSIGNGGDGIHFENSPRFFIEYNVIAENDGVGIGQVDRTGVDPDYAFGFINNNQIGFSVDGTEARPNAEGGIQLLRADYVNILGNSIIGNQDYGISIDGNNNQISNNHVGLNETAVAYQGSQHGIRIRGDENHLAGNVIGFHTHGIDLYRSDNNIIINNGIGTDLTGTADYGNSRNGIYIRTASANNLVGSELGLAPNIIKFNGYDGVRIIGSKSRGNQILGNQIGENGQMGIDLAANGVKLNDLLDGDLGPNHLQNFPVLDSVSTCGVGGSLNSEPDQTYIIEIFTADSCDAVGNGEGDLYLTSGIAQTDENGNVDFSISSTDGFSLPPFFTATATNIATGSTSEFSSCYAPTFTESSTPPTELPSSSSGQAACYPLTGQLEDGGTLQDSSGMILGVLEGTLEEPLLVSLTAVPTPEQPYDGEASIVTNYYQLAATIDIVSSIDKPFVIGIPKPTWLTDNHLSVALFDEERAAWDHVVGNYDENSEMYIFTLTQLSQAGDIFVLTEHPTFNPPLVGSFNAPPPKSTLPKETAQSDTTFGFSVQCHFIVCPPEVIATYEDALKEAHGDFVEGLGFLHPALSRYLITFTPDFQAIEVIETDIYQGISIRYLPGDAEEFGIYAPSSQTLTFFVDNPNVPPVPGVEVRNLLFRAIQFAYPNIRDTAVGNGWLLNGTAWAAHYSSATMAVDPDTYFGDYYLSLLDVSPSQHTQDFWVFIGQEYAFDSGRLSYLHDIFEFGASPVEVGNGFAVEYGHTLSDLYWAYIKNKAYELQNTLDGFYPGTACTQQTGGTYYPQDSIGILEIPTYANTYPGTYAKTENVYDDHGNLIGIKYIHDSATAFYHNRPLLSGEFVRVDIHEPLENVTVRVIEDPNNSFGLAVDSLAYKVYRSASESGCEAVPDGEREFDSLAAGETLLVLVANLNYQGDPSGTSGDLDFILEVIADNEGE